MFGGTVRVTDIVAVASRERRDMLSDAVDSANDEPPPLATGALSGMVSWKYLESITGSLYKNNASIMNEPT